jgi:hypothetical protein
MSTDALEILRPQGMGQNAGVATEGDPLEMQVPDGSSVVRTCFARAGR